MSKLGGASSDTQAWKINDAGHVVGRYEAAAGEMRAFVYFGGQMFDLNDLIPAGSGWILEDAREVGRDGRILGYGKYNGTLQQFLLTPEFTSVKSCPKVIVQEELEAVDIKKPYPLTTVTTTVPITSSTTVTTTLTTSSTTTLTTTLTTSSSSTLTTTTAPTSSSVTTTVRDLLEE